ncbi:MAG: ribosome biogenesis GTPase A [Rhodothermales bacterium]|jgi:ribosome biogenesis GTPase A
MTFDHIPIHSWYPGHMRKAERLIKEKLKLIDVIVELVDARAPQSTQNFQLEELVAHRPRVTVLAKSDLANPETTRAWQDHWRAEDRFVISVSEQDSQLSKRVLTALELAAATRPKRIVRRTRALVLGLPNVGKSTLINRLARRKKAVTGPRPGVTRHQQWVVLGDALELLDTPGIMIPRIPDAPTGLKMGLVAALKDEHLGQELLAAYIIHVCQQQQLPALAETYGIGSEDEEPNELIAAIAQNRGLLLPGNQPDVRRASETIINDFRQGRLGRISLESPNERT